MSYVRKEIAPEEIARQEEICRRIFDRVTADGQRPLAMVTPMAASRTRPTAKS